MLTKYSSLYQGLGTLIKLTFMLLEFFFMNCSLEDLLSTLLKKKISSMLFFILNLNFLKWFLFPKKLSL